uniref:FSA_C domain-containing protein n=1 Tax=Macrostomum lignano TaxID=282301 RepID=A0A1I8FI69_9PLAT
MPDIDCAWQQFDWQVQSVSKRDCTLWPVPLASANCGFWPPGSTLQELLLHSPLLSGLRVAFAGHQPDMVLRCLSQQYLLRLRSFLYDELEAMNASIGADGGQSVAGGGSTSTTARDKVRGDQS